MPLYFIPLTAGVGVRKGETDGIDTPRSWRDAT